MATRTWRLSPRWKALEQVGYKNQIQVVRALQARGYFADSEEHNVATYVSAAVLGTKVSEQLYKGLLDITNNSKDVESAFSAFVPPQHQHDYFQPLREHGFRTQTQFARALQRSGFYPNMGEVTLIGYVGRVLSGKVNSTKQLLQGAMHLCKNDPGIAMLFAPKHTLDEGLEVRINQFRAAFSGADPEAKADLYLRFDDFLRQYVEQTTPQSQLKSQSG
jgi:hypothetical protein